MREGETETKRTDRRETDRQTQRKETQRERRRERGKGEAEGTRVASLRGDRGGILQVQSLNKNAKQNAPIQ